jgi:hypothetical protein
VTFSSNDDSQFYLTNSDDQGSGAITATTLVSPEFSTTGFQSATLSYWHHYRDIVSPDDNGFVEYSTNGTTWTALQTHTATVGATDAFVNATVALPAGALGQGSVRIRFRYTGTWDWWWAVDNVTLSGNMTPTFAWTSDPAGFTSAQQNPAGVVMTADRTFTVTVSNAVGCSAQASVFVDVNTTDTDGDGLIDCNDTCPNVTGQIGSACDDGDPDTFLDALDASCNCTGSACTTNLTLEFTVGANGTLPNWELRAVGSNVVVQSGTGFPLPPGTVFPVTTCLPDGHYYLVVSGAMGTGGGYVLRTSGNPGTRIVDNTANYVSGAVSQVATNDGVQIPIGPNSLIYTSCDKYYWKTGEYIVANEDVQVSAQYGITMTTSGYEFWIYNPNGGYSFRKLRSHSDPDGFAPANALRACHMKINNWAVANHVPQNVLMNVRIRARVAGVNKAWGPACRFIRNDALAACPPTKLMDIPGNQFLSCGQTRAFNALTANRVHARPVTGATQYQFRFSLPGEGGTIVTRGNTTYYINLGWSAAQAPILQNGVTYDVDVRAMVNGVWCVWGDICKLTICNAPPCGGGMEGGNESMLTEGASVLMWPNPNRGDQVLLSIDQLDATTETITVDVLDMTGKRLVARTLAAQQGVVTATLELGGELAAGLYMVNITAGDKLFTERLVIQP